MYYLYKLILSDSIIRDGEMWSKVLKLILTVKRSNERGFKLLVTGDDDCSRGIFGIDRRGDMTSGGCNRGGSGDDEDTDEGFS